MGDETRGQGAALRYIEEAEVGVTPALPALSLFSKETKRVRYFLDKDKKESVDMGEVDVVDLFSTRHVYGVSTEFTLYDPDIVFDLMEREANNQTRSYTFEVIPDQDAAAPVYIRGRGWRPKTVEVSGSVGDPYSVSVEFAGGLWEDPVTAEPDADSRQTVADIVEPVKHFASGAILFDGAAWATLVDGFSIQVDHGTEARYTSGSKDPVLKATEFGHRKITGTADISLDDGVVEHWDRVVAFAKHDIILPFGSSGGDRQWEIAGVRLDRVEPEHGTDVKIVLGSVPWQASGANPLVEGAV